MMGDDFRIDFDEFDIIERHAKEAAARRLAEAKQRNAAAAAIEAKQAAERHERTTALTMRTNEMLRLAEFERHGVEPPAGTSPMSIGLMLQLGWRIEEIMGERKLVAPDHSKPKRNTREDYHRERGA
jgi:hypothetical protein